MVWELPRGWRDLITLLTVSVLPYTSPGGSGVQGLLHGENTVAWSPLARYTGKALSRATGLGCMFILGCFAANHLLLCAYSSSSSGAAQGVLTA